MKNLTVTDLVPVGILVNIAKRIRAEAVAIARAKGLPSRVHDAQEEGISGRSIGIPPPKVTSNQVELGLTLNGIGAAYEWGSGLRSTRGTPGKYPITPKNKQALYFEGTNEYKGQLIITDLVMHPGVSPRPFLEPAKRKTRKINLEEIRGTNLANTRLIIKGMKRKI